jgi:hypothetical protein
MSSIPRQYRRAAIVAAGLSLHMLFAAAQSPRPLLKKYIGNPDTDALLREPAVQSQLKALVGKHTPHLMRNLDVRGDVELIGGALALVGNAVHGGGLEEGIVCIADHGPTPLVEAAIFSKGKIAVYAKAAQYDYLMICIKDWITQVNSGHRDRMAQPKNVMLAKP